MNPETWAVSKSDIFMKNPTGRDAENIAFGSTLSNDRHAGQTFDYLIANPPYGKDWKRDQETVETEHQRGTLFPPTPPVALTVQFYTDAARADRWQGYLNRNASRIATVLRYRG